MGDNVEVGVAIPGTGPSLLPLTIFLGALVGASFFMDAYLYKHQKHVHPIPWRPNRTTTPYPTSPTTYPPTIPPPPSMANWCGHRIVPIKDNVYKVEYDLALVLPFLKLKDNFTVMYKVNAYIWIPIHYTLRWPAPFVSIFIFPQMEPRQAYLFDFEGWKNNTNIVRMLNISHNDSVDGYDIATRSKEALKLLHFDLEDMHNETESFKTFHARFTLYLSSVTAALETCLNDTESCVTQFNSTIHAVHLQERMADAVFVTLGADKTKGIAPDLWQNVSQAVCCEVYRYDGPVLTKMCRVNGTAEFEECPHHLKVSTCWDYGRGY